MCTKRFRTTTVEINARDVLDDSFSGPDGEFRGSGPNLVDEVGSFGRVGCKHGARFAVVGYDAGGG